MNNINNNNIDNQKKGKGKGPYFVFVVGITEGYRYVVLQLLYLLRVLLKLQEQYS